MSLGSVGGLAVLNALYLGTGAALLWLVRGERDWLDSIRLVGLAYLAGVVLTGSLWTLLLVAGVPFSLGLVLGLPIALGLAFVYLGHRRGRGLPRRGRLPGGSSLIVTAAGIAAVGLLLEALFRMARLSGLYWFDAWSFWVPKAKALYFFGALDEQFFTELPGASYPPLVPTLEAAAFFLMGGPDVVTLHLQFWLLAVGFVWALAGILAERVAPWILWPFLVLMVVAPRIGRRFQITEADLLLDFLFVLAAVLMAFWIVERERWRLVVATLLVSGMVLTKREGLLLAVLLFAAAVVATARDRRLAWPALGVSFAVTIVVAAPWRIWYLARDVESEAGSGGLAAADGLGDLGPAAQRALEVFWEPGYWNLIVPLFVGSLVVSVLARVGRPVVFFATLAAFVVAGGIWATWNYSQTGPGLVLGGNFIIRFMGAAALLCVAATPVLLGFSWQRARPDEEPSSPPARRRLGLAAGIVAVPLLVYPAVTLASGGPRFPTRDDCARPATADAPDLEVVYGRFDDPLAAEERLAALTGLGFVGAEVEFDPCGRWKVSYEAIDSLSQGEALAAQVRDQGFDARVEHGG